MRYTLFLGYKLEIFTLKISLLFDPKHFAIALALRKQGTDFKFLKQSDSFPIQVFLHFF